MNTISASGLVSSQRRDQALGSEYESFARLAALQAEEALLASELPLVARAREQAAERLNQLDAFYDKGRVRATRDGTAGARVPAPGQVVKLGDELLQVFGDDKSVIAYLPDIYLFGLAPGDRVELTGGPSKSGGIVEALLTVTDALPPEFQSTFRPRDRSRLVRIRLTEGHAFAVLQKIQVRGCALGWCSSSPSASALIGWMWSAARGGAVADEVGSAGVGSDLAARHL